MGAEAPVCDTGCWAPIEQQAVTAAELDRAARRAPNLVPLCIFVTARFSHARAAAIEVRPNLQALVLCLAAGQEASLTRDRIVKNE